MFDVGFSELVVIGLVALIVIGPERLPRVARTIGHLAGRLQRYVADVKADINREVELDELRNMRDTVQQAASGIESSLKGELSKAENELNAAASSAAGEAPAEVTAQLLEPAAPPMDPAAPDAAPEKAAGTEKPALTEKTG